MKTTKCPLFLLTVVMLVLAGCPATVPQGIGGDARLIGVWEGTFQGMGLEYPCTITFSEVGYVNTAHDPNTSEYISTSGTYTADPTKNPAWLTTYRQHVIPQVQGTPAKATIQSLYRFEGDTLIIAGNAIDQPRPTSFENAMSLFTLTKKQ